MEIKISIDEGKMRSERVALPHATQDAMVLLVN